MSGAEGQFTDSNPAYTDVELNHRVLKPHAKFMICEPHMIATVPATAKECKSFDERVFVLDD